MNLKAKALIWILDFRDEVLIPLAKECLALYATIVFSWRKFKKKSKKN